MCAGREAPQMQQLPVNHIICPNRITSCLVADPTLSPLWPSVALLSPSIYLVDRLGGPGRMKGARYMRSESLLATKVHSLNGNNCIRRRLRFRCEGLGPSGHLMMGNRRLGKGESRVRWKSAARVG